jgi:hypothetical protein
MLRTLGLAVLAALVASASAINITVSSTATHPIPSTLYGYVILSSDMQAYVLIRL